MLDMVEEMWDVVFVMKKGKIAGSYSEAQVKETGSTMEDMYFYHH
jgi:ABC-type dipeptide/oligopeptide/nickel transport system ATPase subunit